MGSGASSYSSELSQLPLEKQQEYQAKFEALKLEGKTDEEAYQVLKNQALPKKNAGPHTQRKQPNSLKVAGQPIRNEKNPSMKGGTHPISQSGSTRKKNPVGGGKTSSGSKAKQSVPKSDDDTKKGDVDISPAPAVSETENSSAPSELDIPVEVGEKLACASEFGGSDLQGFDKLPEEILHLPDEQLDEFKTMFSALQQEAELTFEQVCQTLKKHYACTIPNPKIELADLQEAVSGVASRGKTPLIIDNSEQDAVNTFFSYQNAILVDGKKIGLDKAMRGRSVADILEEIRKKLVVALKMGYPFVIALTNSVTDFATTFNDISASKAGLVSLEEGLFFPLELFRNSGKDLLSDEYLNVIFRDAEKDHGFAISKNPAGFQVIITTRFSFEDFEEYLFGNEWGLPKPKEQYEFVCIKWSQP